VISGVLVLAGTLGVPGLDSPEAAALGEKIAASVGTLLTGWLFFRQEWLGQGKKAPQAPSYDGKH
jgi:hypothetical protein